MAKSSTSFTPGTAPSKGRPKGAVNKSTQQQKDFVQLVMAENMERLRDDLDAMNPMCRWTVLQKLSAWYMPTLTKNDNTNETSGKMTITIKYAEDVVENKPVEEGLKDAE